MCFKTHEKQNLISGKCKNVMKINQLFVKKIDIDVLMKLLSCFGLENLNDRKFFSKYDLLQQNTVAKLNALKPELEEYYLPCKARIYLDNITEKRGLTVLKQVLRLHNYYLLSRERNFNQKKVIFYQLVNDKDKTRPQKMKHYNVINVVHFD